MYYVAEWGIEIPNGMFLGFPIGDWFKVWTCVKSRKITIPDLVNQFEADHPMSRYAWKKHFGVLAELQEEMDASKATK